MAGTGAATGGAATAGPGRFSAPAEGLPMSMRRLPVYLLLDCSESMAGPAIDAVQRGVETLIQELRSNPQALENAYISVITFAKKAQVAVPLTELISFQTPKLSVRTGTSLGEALK